MGKVIRMGPFIRDCQNCHCGAKMGGEMKTWMNLNAPD